MKFLIKMASTAILLSLFINGYAAGISNVRIQTAGCEDIKNADPTDEQPVDHGNGLYSFPESADGHETKVYNCRVSILQPKPVSFRLLPSASFCSHWLTGQTQYVDYFVDSKETYLQWPGKLLGAGQEFSLGDSYACISLNPSEPAETKPPIDMALYKTFKLYHNVPAWDTYYLILNKAIYLPPQELQNRLIFNVTTGDGTQRVYDLSGKEKLGSNKDKSVKLFWNAKDPKNNWYRLYQKDASVTTPLKQSFEVGIHDDQPGHPFFKALGDNGYTCTEILTAISSGNPPTVLGSDRLTPQQFEDAASLKPNTLDFKPFSDQSIKVGKKDRKATVILDLTCKSKTDEAPIEAGFYYYDLLHF